MRAYQGLMCADGSAGYGLVVDTSAGPSGPLRPPLRYRLTEAQWRWIDVTAAVAAFAIGALKLDLPRAAAAGPTPPGPTAVAMVALGTLPFAVRRSRPLAALAAATIATAVLAGFGRSPLVLNVTTGVAAYMVAARCPRKVALAAFVAAEAALWTGVGVAVGRGVEGYYVFVAAFVTWAAWFAGNSVRYQRRYSEAVAAEQERRRQEGLDKARQAIREERVRIARELHDVVAHSLTVMTVQAGVASRVIERPEQVRGILQSIESTGRVAQGELRLCVKPQASPALELSLYRVVQEALTNAVKHAPGSPTTIDLTYAAREISVEVLSEPGAGS